MRDLISTGLRRVNGRVEVLDQRLLPGQEVWIDASTPQDMEIIIKNLQVRGAPLIGVAAALSLAHFAQTGASQKEVEKTAQLLNEARPTAVNLMLAMNRLVFNSKDFAENYSAEKLMAQAEELFDEDVALCEKIAENGSALVEDGDHILTHCNTGGIATAGVGTAIGIIRKAHDQGKKIHVYVDETRPLLQGGRLTTWELEKLGIPYTLICDNMAASLMASGKIDKIFVGSDRVALNGDFANKVGTYSLAVVAQYHNVPFYPVAPYTTIDFSIETGKEIPIEMRKPSEVQGVAGFFSGEFQEVKWSPEKSAVYNPAFDVTPVDLVTALVLDTGVLSREQLQAGLLKNEKK